MKKVFLITLLGLFAVSSFASAQTSREEAGLTPKSSFYFLDSFGEWLNLKITFNKEKKAEKKLKYADERLAELRALAEDDEALEEKHAVKIKDKFEELTAGAADDVDDLKAQGRDVASLIKKMEILASEHTLKLEAVLDRAPERAREAIEHALEVSRRGHERAIEALSKEVEEGEIEEEELEEETRKKIEEARERIGGMRIAPLELESDLEELNSMLEEAEEGSSDALENELENLEL